MKGKIKNYKFVSEYISKCSLNGNNQSSDILIQAQNRINEIDIILKSIILLKEERSNLLDVIHVLKNE